MFSKTVPLLLVFLAVASGLEWPRLIAKWGVADFFRVNSFFDIPRTISEASKEGWVKVDHLNALNLTTYCYPNDGQLCIMFDKYGYFVGLQPGILANDVEPTAHLYKTSDFAEYSNKTIFNKKYVTVTVYTVNPANIHGGGRSDSNLVIGTEGIWFETSNGYVYIPRFAKDLDSQWIKEACIPGMGTHYYLNIHPDTDCKTFYPIFLLYIEGELAGIGLQAFGACTIEDRSWCEWVPAVAIRPTIPTTPQCLVDWVAKYGVISMHFYFVSKPREITCN